jgi:hypothetical protein
MRACLPAKMTEHSSVKVNKAGKNLRAELLASNYFV